METANPSAGAKPPTGKGQDQPGKAPETRLPRILAPPQLPRPKGYAHGMAATGRLVVTAGHVGWDAQGRFAVGIAGQVEQALRNIVQVLAEADAEPQHLVRLTWYVTSRAAYLAEQKAIGIAYRRVIGRHYPAMAVVEVAALMEPEALVEIEATAVVG